MPESKCRIGGQLRRKLKKPGKSIPVRAPAGDSPDPVICPLNTLDRTFRSPIAAQTDSIEKKKNRAYQPARFGAYPSCRILLAVRVQKFCVMCD